jgi:hypothetical protein
MGKSLSDQRMAENEVIFRKYNERVSDSFEEFKQIAKEDNQEHLIAIHDQPIQFVCECSDRNCKDRISLTLDAYLKIHIERNRFIILKNHESGRIEHVVAHDTGYDIVEKFDVPSEAVTALH